jgi:hypothetical protein
MLSLSNFLLTLKEEKKDALAISFAPASAAAPTRG